MLSSEQSRLTACYAETLETLELLKPSSNKYYQLTNEEDGDNGIVSEEDNIKKLIESMNNCDVKLIECYKLWKVLLFSKYFKKK